MLALGLLLTAGTALAGERILGWLGLVSGVVVLAVGGSMLLAIVRRRAGQDRRLGNLAAPLGAVALPNRRSHADHDHAHAPRPRRHATATVTATTTATTTATAPRSRHAATVGGELGLAGIGLAGGLVPSPSALVVLLAAIGLGRTDVRRRCSWSPTASGWPPR